MSWPRKIRLEIPDNAPGCFLIRGVSSQEDDAADQRLARQMTLLVQTDWDFPGVATSFGWSVADVIPTLPDGFQDWRDGGAGFAKKEVAAFKRFEKRWFPGEYDAPLCSHEGTDGTIKCPGCKLEPSVFIASARKWLEESDGAIAENPGYELE